MTNGFYYPPDISAQENYVRDIVRDPVRYTMEHHGRQQYADAHLYQHGSSGQQSSDVTIWLFRFSIDFDSILAKKSRFRFDSILGVS